MSANKTAKIHKNTRVITLARQFDMSKHVLYRAIKAGKLVAIKTGENSMVVTPRAWDDYIASLNSK